MQNICPHNADTKTKILLKNTKIVHM